MYSAPFPAHFREPQWKVFLARPGASGIALPSAQPSWPSARLASLHRGSPRGPLPPAMALLRFRVSSAHQARPIVPGSCFPSPSASWVRPTWRLAPGLALPTVPLSAALARFPSRSMPPPGSAPVSRPVPSCGCARAFLCTPAPLQGLAPRTELREVLDGHHAASSGFPSRVFASAALAHGLFPGHPLVRFPRGTRVACNGWRSRVLRSGRIGLPLGCLPLWVSRPCGHAGFFPPRSSPSEL